MDSLAIIAADILGGSKASVLYKYYYVLKPTFTIRTPLTPIPGIRICYIDADCLVVYIKADEEDYLRVMKSVVAEHFDCSNLPTDHPLYSRERVHLIGVL